MKLCEYLTAICVLLVSILLMAMGKPTDASAQNDRGAGLLGVSIEDYEERLEYEKKVLDGLMKLLDLKEREIISDKIIASELVARNENLSINKETSEHGRVSYTIKANLVTINEILHALVSTSGRELVVDEDINKKEMSSVVSVFLKHAPFLMQHKPMQQTCGCSASDHTTKQPVCNMHEFNLIPVQANADVLLIYCRPQIFNCKTHEPPFIVRYRSSSTSTVTSSVWPDGKSNRRTSTSPSC